MSETTTERYHLYAAAFNRETAEIALNEPYSKASKTHILIYRKEGCPEGYKEIKDADVFMLPSTDQQWLGEVNKMLIQRFLIEHREERERADKKFLEELERELENERRKLSETGSGETCKG